MYLTPLITKFRETSMLGFLCAMLAVFQFGCASGGAGTGSRQLGSISIARTDQTRAMQAATVVLARYSYATVSAQPPVSMVFQKTGNAADPLITTGGTSGSLELTFSRLGSETIVTAHALSGQYDTAKVRSLLSAIREESQSRAFANQIYGDG